jgi:hypothetical protein
VNAFVQWWLHIRAVHLMSRHERWRVAMGCPGVPHPDPLSDTLTPRRGEVYCRCEKCVRARELVGWDPV